MDCLNYNDMINHSAFKPLQGYTEISSKGHLIFAGKDTIDLVKQYGTPLFVFSETKIRSNFRKIKTILHEKFEKFEVCFAYKSNSLLAILNVLRQEGAFADVVSEGEFRKALYVGYPPDNIVCNGNNKSRAELRLSINSAAIINCDSLSELYMIIDEAKKLGKVARLCIRVNCNVDSGVIPEFSTALKSSKFGVDLDGEAYTAFEQAMKSPYCEVLGIHSHIGSQIESGECFRYAATKIMDFCGRLKKELGLNIHYVNMGGGYTIPFEFLSQYDTMESIINIIAEIFDQKIAEYGLEKPTLIIEPGGSIIGTTAVALFTVGTVKQKEKRTLAAINAGADTLLRATQGWYTYRAVCAGKMNKKADKLYDIVGPLCYEGDIPAHNRMMPDLEENDVIAFLDAGAYTTTLFNNYNGRYSLAVLMVKEDGAVHTIKERQTFEDLIRGENM